MSDWGSDLLQAVVNLCTQVDTGKSAILYIVFVSSTPS